MNETLKALLAIRSRLETDLQQAHDSRSNFSPGWMRAEDKQLRKDFSEILDKLQEQVNGTRD